MTVEDCPVCPPGTCKGYPHLWKRLREDPGKWRAVHDRVNSRPTEAYPSLATIAGNAVKAAAGFIAGGLRVVDKPEQARRLAICRGCEHFDARQGRCRLCGCYTAFKVRLATGGCPDKPPRW